MSTHRLRLARYQKSRQLDYDAYVKDVLVPGARVLDVGSGRTPSLAASSRPPGCHYVGLDISAEELERAGPGSYDETWVSDITSYVPSLEQSFDVIVSWQVLEHVKPLDTAVANMRMYLRPGGRLVAYLSGAYSLFGIINRIVPSSVGVWALHTLLQRDPETVFPAYYHHCWDRALQQAFRDWQSCDIFADYYGADYFRFFGPAERAYLVYEDWAVQREYKNLATHYLIVATR